MRVFLVEAPYQYGAVKSLAGKHFPLGLGYLASYLRERGVEVRMALGPGRERLMAELADFQPDLVGVSCVTPTFAGALAICHTVKEYGDIPTILGGPHVTGVKEQIFKTCPEVDFLVYGEGEETLWELCRAVEGGVNGFSGIDGLIYRQPGGEVKVNPPRRHIKEVDTIPFPARDLLDLTGLGAHRYVDTGRASGTMISSRGCPFNCAFCASHLTMGRRYRYRSAANVIQEIDELVLRFGVNHISFEDDTFTLWPERVEEICEALIARRYDLTWFCMSRVDTINEPLARLMRRSGCRLVSFGIESGDEAILKRLRKKISLPQAQAAIDACYRAGLKTQATFIVGLPYDTRQTLRETLRFAQRISPTIAIFFSLVPYPGTEMFQYLPEEYRSMRPEDWGNFSNMFTDQGYLSVMPGVSGRELARINELWHLRFYLRPRQLYRMLRTLHTNAEFFSFLESGWCLARKVALNLFHS